MRPDWDEYFMEFAKLAARRSACIRRQVGAVIVKDHAVITTGYNGPPRGLPHASEVGCLRARLGVPSGERQELCRGLHAEQNAIIQGARHGIALQGATLYCTLHPCTVCLKMIINVGIEKVIYLEGYPDEAAREALWAGVPKTVQITRLDVAGSATGSHMASGADVIHRAVQRAPCGPLDCGGLGSLGKEQW